MDAPAPAITVPSSDELAEISGRVRASVRAHEDELPVIANALQLESSANREHAEVRGVIPEYAPSSNHADVRSMVTNSLCRSP